MKKGWMEKKEIKELRRKGKTEGKILVRIKEERREKKKT